MAKRQPRQSVPSSDANSLPNDLETKLRKLLISNFGCIGDSPVEIELDDIVVLVGQNNTGKSTILRAYDVLFGTSKPTLTITDFPNHRPDPDKPTIIELHTKTNSKPPGQTWIEDIDGEFIVRERWVWTQPGEGTRQGFDVAAQEWSARVPWGAANVANSRRPKPHRLEAFASPEEQANSVAKVLLETLKGIIASADRTVTDADGNEVMTEYGKLLADFEAYQSRILTNAEQTIDRAQTYLTELVQRVFQGYEVRFLPEVEDDPNKSLTFFKKTAALYMGPAGGHQSPVELQGSGARRTLMWAALKYAAEQNAGDNSSRPNLLLLDEPELCLHPNAIREACKVLYDLPKSGNWQVMVTTHSPAFIDLSRDNTTVVRVDRISDGRIRGTTVFRPERAKLSADEREELKMLNLCDPHLCEFFFGGRTVLVEGDTEHTAFRFVTDKYSSDPKLRDIHIVRARGKATLRLLAKILNQFHATYSILHDSDVPEIMRKKRGKAEEYQPVANGAWTTNQEIQSEVDEAVKAGRVRLVALVPHFEGAFFGDEAKSEKPLNAWRLLRANDHHCESVRDLLHSLVDHANPIPSQGLEWSDIAELRRKLDEFESTPAA